MNIYRPLKGETWEWNEEGNHIEFTNRQQGILDVYMKWVIGWLMESAIDNAEIQSLEKEAHKDIIAYVQQETINAINLLKNVGYYPDEYMYELCTESKTIFERDLTCYELYRVIYALERLEERFQLVIWKELDTKPEDENEYVKGRRKYKKRLFETPTMFKYH